MEQQIIIEHSKWYIRWERNSQLLKFENFDIFDIFEIENSVINGANIYSNWLINEIYVKLQELGRYVT